MGAVNIVGCVLVFGWLDSGAFVKGSRQRAAVSPARTGRAA